MVEASSLELGTEVRASIVRILGPNGTVGTGFVVDRKRGLVATCVHVVKLAHRTAGELVGIVHHASGSELVAEVLATNWHETEDVAFLTVRGPLPESADAVIFSAKTPAVGHPFKTFGFPPAKPTEGLATTGLVINEARDEKGRPVLQLKDTDVVPGFSGAPLFDLTTQRVAGMVVAITEGDHGRLEDTAFAIPASTILAIEPSLKSTDVAPYRALGVFDEADADLYYGRTEAVDRIVHELQDGKRFLAVLGPSGSGKSSLVRAGVVPALRRMAQHQPWDVVVMRPADLNTGSPDAAMLVGGSRQLALRLERENGATRMLLVIDQFEEAFVNLDETQRSDLLTSVSDVVSSTVRVSVVVTMRDEFFSQLAHQAPSLAGSLEEGLRLLPPHLSRRDLHDIVARPAESVGIRFAPNLVDLIVKDAIVAAPGNEPGTAANTVLPLLEFTLSQLWDIRIDGVLSLDGYNKVGEVTGGITTWAEKALEDIGEARRPTVRRLLIDLVHLGDPRLGIPDTRVRRRRQDLVQRGDGDETKDIVKVLTDRHLVVTSQDPADGTPLVELIHDAIIRAWERLRVWLDEDRRFLAWRQDLEQRREQWVGDEERAEPDPDKLLRGRDLEAADDLNADALAQLNDDQRDFIQASRDARDAAQRRRTWAMRAVAVLVVMVLVFGIAAGFAAVKARESARQAQVAEHLAQVNEQEAVVQRNQAGALALASASRDVAGSGNPALALALAAESSAATPIPLWQSTIALVGARLAFSNRVAQPIGEPADVGSSVRAVTFSPDGKKAAAAGFDGTIRVWELSDGRPSDKPLVITATVSALAFTSDSTLVAYDSDNGRLASWQGSTPTSLSPATRAARDGVQLAAFSPDAASLAVVENNQLRMWNVKNAQQMSVQLIDGVGAQARGVAFSGDGTKIAIAGSGGFQVFDGSGRAVMSAPWGDANETTHDQFWMSSLAFSRDGSMVAAGGADGVVLVRDTANPRSVGQPLASAASRVTSLAFAPDGRTLAAGSANGRMQLWDPLRGSPIGDPLTGHNGQVSAVAFNPAGNELLSASSDTTARFWDLSRGEAISNRVPDHDAGAATAISVAYNPAGDELVVIDGNDGRLRLLDASSGSMLAPQPNSAVKAGAIAFLPDGTLVTVGPDDMVRFRNPRTGDELRAPLRAGGPGSLSAATLSADGKKLAAVGSNAVWLWDLTTGDSIGQPLVGDLSWTLNVALSPDGTLLATQRYLGEVRLWDTATHLPIADPLPEVHSMEIAFSSVEDVLAQATGNTVRVWDVKDGHPTNERVLSHPSDVNTVAFSPDGRMIVTGTSGTEVGDAELRLWDAGSGRALGEPLTSSSGPFEALAFDRSGTELVTAASGFPADPGIGGVRLWRPVWDADDACRVGARYVTRAQVERLAPPGRKLEACDYLN